MQTRKFDELISYFNRKVSSMDIDQKYKMELLGMITAIGLAHEKEMPHWVLCSERLPKKAGWYICSIQDGRVNSLYYEQRLGWINTAKKHMFELYDIYSKLTGTKIKPEQECIDWNGWVIAWMPLPEPYWAERRTDEPD